MSFFKDNTLQQQFDEKGYVIVDFLNAEEVNTFLEFLNATPITYESGIFSSIFHWDEEQQTLFSDLTQSIVQQKIHQILPDWKAYGASYIVKSPDTGEKSNFDLHQDFNMTDESYIPSFGLWMSLVDTNPSNGGLCVLPGSDKKFKGTVRSANTDRLFLQIDDEVNTVVEYLDVKAGQACIFSHTLFHGSQKNKSSAYRPIIHAGLFAPDAKIRHYPKSINSQGKEEIEILEISLEYYFYNIKEFLKNPKSGPHKTLGVLENYTPTPTRADILKSYGFKQSIKKERNGFVKLYQKIKSKF